MFYLHLRLQTRYAGSFEYAGPWLTGARALDFARVHRLPVATPVAEMLNRPGTATSGNSYELPVATAIPHAAGYCGATDRVVELPEAIAREMLAESQVQKVVVVHPDDLLPGEVVLADHYHGFQPPKRDQKVLLALAVGEVTLERALVITRVAELRQRAEQAEAEAKQWRLRAEQAEAIANREQRLRDEVCAERASG